jgi:hypothetical protein
MAQLKSSVAENFSITNGGPLHWLLVRLEHAAYASGGPLCDTRS